MVIEALKQKQWVYHRPTDVIPEPEDRIHVVSDRQLPGHLIAVLVRRKAVDLLALDENRTRKTIPTTQILGVVPLDTVPTGHRMENVAWTPTRTPMVLHRIAYADFKDRIQKKIVDKTD